MILHSKGDCDNEKTKLFCIVGDGQIKKTKLIFFGW